MNRPRKQGGFAPAAAAAAAAVAMCAASATESSCEPRGTPAFVESVRSAIGLFLDDTVPEEIVFDQAVWNRFLNLLDHALQSQSVEELAWLQPAVEDTIEYLDRFSVFTPFTDWLKQRKDYFDMAADVMENMPVAAPPASPATKARPQRRASHGPAPVPRRPARRTASHGAPAPQPAPQKPAAPVPPAAPTTPEAAARNPEAWRKKLATRPAPNSSAELAPRLKKIFAEHGLPPELVWLAEVESSMDPDARSPAGAIGLFQLMPAAAGRFGLRTGPGDDDRRHPEKNARAAALYLKTLHGRFGSWPLAIAAYNGGEGRVNSLLRKHDASSLDAIMPYLPVETQMYVPKTAALISIREQKELAALPPPST